MDLNSATNLSIAPAITRKVRHIRAKHHEIVTSAEFLLVHIPAPETRNDMLTKVLRPSQFLSGRFTLLNIAVALVENCYICSPSDDICSAVLAFLAELLMSIPKTSKSYRCCMRLAY